MKIQTGWAGLIKWLQSRPIVDEKNDAMFREFSVKTHQSLSEKADDAMQWLWNAYKRAGRVLQKHRSPFFEKVEPSIRKSLMPSVLLHLLKWIRKGKKSIGWMD
ncbi:hypothetical protein PsorP6_009468 [Peronosclerospora sorghi]|uniref:Uncharacterized protein n=1 Tax=Peronosclerospora sorghi TaxID=230839 RepID=A0ACC0W255_9STRA|nr:hypothetical protein PsorP6_009468 [Peronosclerospora sorghi]